MLNHIEPCRTRPSPLSPATCLPVYLSPCFPSTCLPVFPPIAPPSESPARIETRLQPGALWRDSTSRSDSNPTTFSGEETSDPWQIPQVSFTSTKERARCVGGSSLLANRAWARKHHENKSAILTVRDLERFDPLPRAPPLSRAAFLTFAAFRDCRVPNSRSSPARGPRSAVGGPAPNRIPWSRGICCSPAHQTNGSSKKTPAKFRRT